MKHNLLKRGAAMLAAACIMLPMLAVSAGAETDGGVLLPSGHSTKWVEEQLKYINDDNDSFETVIFQGDEILYSGCFGEADRENHIPADENTVYEWGSISKTMTWVSVMQLWEQGLLDLEADIRTYLPEGFFRHLRYDDPITMLDLMNHKGGWAEPTYGFGTTDASKILSLCEALQTCEPAQVARPGEMTSYSNWGATLAGYIVECVSGMDYCDYVHTNILEPLGMEHTAVSADHSDNPWVQERREQMKSYQISSFGAVRALGSCLTYIRFYPAGSATGTIGDLLRYAQAFVDDSAPLFQNPETQAKLFSASDFFGDSDIPTSFHGFASLELGVRVIGHDGSTFGYQSMMLFDPVTKIGMVYLTNDPSSCSVCPLIPEFVFGTMKAGTYAPDETAEPPDFSGYYLPARSCLKGLLKFQPYLDAQHIGDTQEYEQIGAGVYQITGEGTAQILGSEHYSDGRLAMNLGSADYIRTPGYLPMIFLFAAYVTAALVSVYLLRINHRLKKAGQQQSSVGGGIRMSAQIAKICSMLMLLLTAAVYAKFYSLPTALGIAAGVLQMVCIALCAAAAAVSARELLTQKAVWHRLRNLCGIAGNAATVCAVILFEMYRFWGC